MGEITDAFLKGLPKAELHLHIEGSFEPDLMFAIAQRNGITLPYANIDALKKAYDFANLQDFLDIYYQGMSVLHTEQDFFDLTMAYLTRANADGVIHTEIFFDPQGHTERGIAFETVITGITRALKKAEEDFGLTYKLIMCFLRHLSEEDALSTWEDAQPYLDWIHGVGLDSSEVGHPPEKFKTVFAKAKAAGLNCVAHAGEEGPPSYVWGALQTLNVDRIDHGNRALEDMDLVKVLKDKRIPLTVCPLSNLKLCVVDDMSQHPIKKMLDLGLVATVNSDDPSYFGGYVAQNFMALRDALPLTRDDFVTLARNSLTSAFVSEAQKQDMCAKLDAYLTT